MIHLEILKCSDPLSLGVYEFEFDQVFIGRSKKNDLIFLDAELPFHFLTIKTVQNQLIIQSSTQELFYFVNGKKISGVLKIKPNDIIGFGPNLIRIIKSKTIENFLDLTLLYEEFNKKAPELKFALEFIEDIIVKLEEEENVQK